MSNCNAEIDLKKIKNIHMIGIGGASMSGLAELLLGLGFSPRGSDALFSPILQRLNSMGIKAFCGHSEDNLDASSDLLIYSSAVDFENPEIKKALALNIPILSRAEAIGLILPLFGHTTGVSGTHGKSTVSSLITNILWSLGLRPSFNLGCVPVGLEDESPACGVDYFVLEACEYKDSFHNFACSTGIILNIELEHVDYFKDIEQTKNSFYKFAEKIKKGGSLVVCDDDENARDVCENLAKNRPDINILTYGLESERAHITAKNITYDKQSRPSYALYKNGNYICDISLSLTGRHNALNSLAVIGACMQMGIDAPKIKDILASVKGAKKRMEYLGVIGRAEIYEDYGHHPTEIRAVLESVKRTGKRIICVFQPHTYTRTKTLADDLASSLSLADKVYLTDIWASREPDPGDVHSSLLAEKLENTGALCLYCPDYNEIARLVRDDAASGDCMVVIYMGAGDIGKAARILVS